MRKEAVDLSIRSQLYPGRQLIGHVTLIVCAPLRDQIDQSDIRRYTSVQFNLINSNSFPILILKDVLCQSMVECFRCNIHMNEKSLVTLSISKLCHFDVQDFFWLTKASLQKMSKKCSTINRKRLRKLYQIIQTIVGLQKNSIADYC